MLRVLDDRDLPGVLELLDRDPVANVFVTSRVDAAGLAPERLGAQVWGYGGGSRPSALCYAVSNLFPVGADEPAGRGFSGFATRRAHGWSSIVSH